MQRRTREQWRELVEEFEGTDLTHREFAETYGVGVGAFRSWLYRFRRERGGGGVIGFAEVMVAEAPSRHAADGWHLELPGDVAVRLDSAPDPCWLAELCAALAAAR